MKFEVGKKYVDRKGFVYLCVDVGARTVTFEAHRADGSVTLGARYHDGRYRQDGAEHDYDLTAELAKEGAR